DGLSMSGRARSDGYRVEAGLMVGEEMAVAHDEAGADATDAEILAARQTRQIIQRRVHGRLSSAIYNPLAVSTRSSRGKGKLTCSSRTVRVSTRAPKWSCNVATHSCTTSSGALAPAVISTVSSPMKASAGRSRMLSIRYAGLPCVRASSARRMLLEL